MSLEGKDRGRSVAMVLAMIVNVSAGRAIADAPSNLSTPGNTYTTASHYVSTTVFPWYSSTDGQHAGPWAPIEGRWYWTGEADWWRTQVKQMMAANIDVLMVQKFTDNQDWTWRGANSGWAKQRINLFQSLHDLRAQGYNVPKICPFLDTSISAARGWDNALNGGTSGAAGVPVDLSTSTGKDAFVNQFIEFYKEYYSVNTDAYADSYIAQLGGRVILDSYGLGSTVASNVSSLTRADVQSRLYSALGAQHPLFNSSNMGGALGSGTHTFVSNTTYGPLLSFADEILEQFGPAMYYKISSLGARKAAKVSPGFWDENIRNPGTFLARGGGTHYKDAWSSAQSARSGGLRHVNVESWNEYDEGSGIYAAKPDAPYVKSGSGNAHTDTWSSTNNPYEYIKTTAAGARLFNDTPDLGATILWHNLPTTMRAGQTGEYQVVVRNDGDLSWIGAAGFKFGEEEIIDATLFGSGRYMIDDTTNEIPTYGGVFRGRPITFDVQLTAPATPGTYTTHWSMVQEHVAWFGQELTQEIVVTAAPEPSVIMLLSTGLLSVLIRVAAQRRHR